jgi:hypothetical protein
MEFRIEYTGFTSGIWENFILQDINLNGLKHSRLEG